MFPELESVRLRYQHLPGASWGALFISLIVLCIAASSAFAQVAAVDHDALVKHVTDILTSRTHGRVEKWTRPITVSVSAGDNKAAYQYWNGPFISYCEGLHIKWRGLAASEIADADVQVYVLDDLAPTLLKLKPIINEQYDFSDAKYAEWAKHINDAAKAQSASYQVFVSNNDSLQKVLILLSCVSSQRQKRQNGVFSAGSCLALSGRPERPTGSIATVNQTIAGPELERVASGERKPVGFGILECPLQPGDSLPCARC
jgi:hypothetical protein